MPKALSFDLRSRVLAAIDAGLSCRQAAARFGVSASSAIRWQRMRRAGGDARPKPQGGDRLSRRTEAHADLSHAALAEEPDITLPALKACLAEQGAAFRGTYSCQRSIFRKGPHSACGPSLERKRPGRAAM